MAKQDDVFDIWFQYANKEISIHQLRAQLKDLGWTDDEIDTALNDDDTGEE